MGSSKEEIEYNRAKDALEKVRSEENLNKIQDWYLNHGKGLFSRIEPYHVKFFDDKINGRHCITVELPPFFARLYHDGDKPFLTEVMYNRAHGLEVEQEVWDALKLKALTHSLKFARQKFNEAKKELEDIELQIEELR